MSQNTNPPSGLSKHIYSTNPDQIVEDNLYSKDKSSLNKDESYVTLDNKVMPTDTTKKINPFNVKGVPGCRECGGSGWKDTRHPHPCNECAKRTVPVIDTYLTKVGQTSTPVIEEIEVIKQVPVTEYVDHTKTVPMTRLVEVTNTVPVTKMVEVTETIPKRTTETVTKEVEQIKQVPVTRNVQYIENVQVNEQVPVTKTVPVTKEVPITKTKQVIEQVPVTTTVPITKNIEIMKEVPITKTKQVTENIQVKEMIPVMEQVEITKSVPTTRYVEVKENLPTTTRITKTEENIVGSTPIIDQGSIENFSSNFSDKVNLQDDRNMIHNKHHFTSVNSAILKGVPGCKHCGGEGQIKSRSGKRMKTCKDCVKMTGNCIICNNSGLRPDNPNKKCECMYGKNKTIK